MASLLSCWGIRSSPISMMALVWSSGRTGVNRWPVTCLADLRGVVTWPFDDVRLNGDVAFGGVISAALVWCLADRRGVVTRPLDCVWFNGELIPILGVISPDISARAVMVCCLVGLGRSNRPVDLTEADRWNGSGRMEARTPNLENGLLPSHLLSLILCQF